EEAKKLWVEKFNEITKKQNSDEENEYFKSMYPKQKSYIPRFSFLLNILNSFFNEDVFVEEIHKMSMEGAIKLSNYFVATAKKIKFENKQVDDIKKSINRKSLSIHDKIKDAYMANPNFNRSQLAEILDVSRQTVYNYVKKIKEGIKNK
ncbi:MAG TPA: helix-turn-helix domain-containing protein, partial [Chitinophagaceae bacterium]|nr:helix-turn-helix domain-containing protein [Chitinophagaceae bacterium]